MADNEPIDLEAARVRRELLRRLEREDWGTIIKKLTRYAQKRIGRRPFGQDAEDLAQSAVRHLFEHPGAWDQERVPLPEHLGSVLNGIVANARRIGPNKRRSSKDDEGVEETSLAEVDHDAPAREAQGARADREDPNEDGRFRPSGAVFVRPRRDVDPRDEEHELGVRDVAAKLAPRLLAHFAKDALALTVMEMSARGLLPREQADALDRSILDVLAARRRIEREAKRILEELEATNEHPDDDGEDER